MGKNKELMADKAYEELKWKILNREIKGDRLYNEQSISELINIGRSPVRSALLRLHHDRLVEIIPRKGMLVRSISHKEVQEVIQIRLCVEPLVAKLAVQNATSDDIAEIEALLQQLDNDKNNNKLAMRIDHQFHIILAKAGGNSVLEEVVRFLKNRSSILWSKNIVTAEQIQQVKDEHKEILQAIKDRNEDAAINMMTQHISKLTDSII